MTLSPTKIQEIESLTLDILNDVYGNIDDISPPISIINVLKQYDIRIRIGEFNDPEISGYYERKKKTIAISKSDSTKRQIFTIAHELGHHILHQNKEEVFHRKDSMNIAKEKDPKETEANWFAASLLMPEYLVKRVWPIIKSIKFMAEEFNVSHLTSYYRLKNLGLLENQEDAIYQRMNQ